MSFMFWMIGCLWLLGRIQLYFGNLMISHNIRIIKVSLLKLMTSLFVMIISILLLILQLEYGILVKSQL